VCVLLQVLRTGSFDSGGSGSGDETPSPKSHATQLINLVEMQQLSTQEDLAALQLQQQQQQPEQHHLHAALPPAAVHEQLLQHASNHHHLDHQQSVTLYAAESVGHGQDQHQQRQQQQSLSNDSSLALSAGVGQSRLAESHSDVSGMDQQDVYDDEELLVEDGLLGDEDGDREMSVNCQQAEENKLSFQLKFTAPEGGQPSLWGCAALAADGETVLGGQCRCHSCQQSPSSCIAAQQCHRHACLMQGGSSCGCVAAAGAKTASAEACWILVLLLQATARLWSSLLTCSKTQLMTLLAK
jgi:hypothetical protein